jgi:hypothetical protein
MYCTVNEKVTWYSNMYSLQLTAASITHIYSKTGNKCSLESQFSFTREQGWAFSHYDHKTYCNVFWVEIITKRTIRKQNHIELDFWNVGNPSLVVASILVASPHHLPYANTADLLTKSISFTTLFSLTQMNKNIHSTIKVMQLRFKCLLTAVTQCNSVGFIEKNIQLWLYHYRNSIGHMALYHAHTTRLATLPLFKSTSVHCQNTADK